MQRGSATTKAKAAAAPTTTTATSRVAAPACRKVRAAIASPSPPPAAASSQLIAIASQAERDHCAGGTLTRKPNSMLAARAQPYSESERAGGCDIGAFAASWRAPD